MSLSKLFLFFATMFLLSTVVCALPVTKEQILIVPNCMINDIGENVEFLSQGNKFSLIRVSNEGLSKIISNQEKNKSRCGRFLNMTGEWRETGADKAKAKAFLDQYINPHPASVKFNHAGQASNVYTIQHPLEVSRLFNQMNPQDMWSDLTTLTAFHSRAASTQNGVDAAYWIKAQVEEMAKRYGRTDVKIDVIQTDIMEKDKEYIQPSIVVKVGDSSEEGVVLGAHIDTMGNYDLDTHYPGADDDGTGVVTVLEVARTVMSSGMHFKKPIYFIWYAAEEVGLLGSWRVVNYFLDNGIPVKAVLQLDMTGYMYQNDPSIWLMRDHVSIELSNYLAELIQDYVKRPVKYTSCGYSCSDHAFWYGHGVPAAMPAETSFEDTNPNRHLESDTMDKLSLIHMTDFTKLAIAFAVELAEPLK